MRLPGLLLGIALLAVAPSTAHAAGAGQIDHVETTDDGAVQMLYSVTGLPDGVSPDLDTIEVRLGDRTLDSQALPGENGQIERTAVLALDVSQSMRGERFDAARSAALSYVDAAPDDLSIGLVTFAGSVDVVRRPTTNHGSLTADIEALTLSQGTMLYDGVTAALTQTGRAGQRDVVVLSDGADTGGAGDTTLADVVRDAQDSGVEVNVVALGQSATGEQRLREVTDAAGGEIVRADPAALEALFASEAEALAQQILVEFEPAQSGDATVTVSVEAAGQTFTDSTFVTLPGAAEEPAAAPGQLPAGAGGPQPVAEPALTVGPRWLLAGVGALGVGLATALGLLMVGRPRRAQSLVERQLAHYGSTSPGPGGPGPALADGRGRIDVRGSAVAVADQIVKRGDLETRLNRKLTAAGLSLTAAEWLLLHAGVAMLCAIVGFAFTGGLVGLGVLLLLGIVVPYLFLGLKESRRTKAFNSQLAETLQLMAGGLSAGLSLPQAVDTVVREGTEPMAGELRRALVEQRLGVDIEEALEGVGERMDCKDFLWVVMAIRIQREVGGNLAELLNTVAATIREREYLRRQVLTLSAEGRLSAWILGGLPPVFVAYLALTNPDYLQPLITTSIGWVMSAVALLLLVAGSFWMSKLVKVDV